LRYPRAFCAAMKVLDGDGTRLCTGGQAAARDIVQFVS
jgi:hypothetical protein